MEDPRALESQETGEGRNEAGDASRELEEATFEPEARVERGESIEQAEAIKAAFVDAVQVTVGEEIAALPLPDPARLATGDEISATPITLPGAERPATADGVSATPITLPDGIGPLAGEAGRLEGGRQGVEGLPIPIPYPQAGAGGEQVSATPITLPDEISPLDRQADRVAGGRQEVEGLPVPIPYPRQDSAGEEVSATPITLPDEIGPQGASGLEPGSEAPGQEGTLSGELGDQGDGQVDVLAPVSDQVPEVEEYWEPPEMYVYRGPDGSISFVDAQGNPIASPPFLKGVPDGDAGGSYSAWYYGTDPSEVFEVKEYIPPTSDVHAYLGQDGSVVLVDDKGNPIASPPAYFRDGEPGELYTKGPDGSKVPIQIFQPASEGVYAYTAQDGSIRLVDENGKDVQCPPWVYSAKGDGQDQLYTKGADGKAIEIPAYQSQVMGVYAYTAQDGSIRLVDKNGKDVPCPPWVYSAKGDGQDQLYTKGADGKAIEIPAYQSQVEVVYAYTAQDGSIRLVDENGKDVPCPPSFVEDPEKGGVFTKGPDGQKIEITAYQPSLAGVFAHIAPDGFVTLVDKDGALVYSPPSFYKDGTDGTVYGVGPKGEKVEIPPYKPVSAHFKQPSSGT
jgi:hypothetical protein